MHKVKQNNNDHSFMLISPFQFSNPLPPQPFMGFQFWLILEEKCLFLFKKKKTSFNNIANYKLIHNNGFESMIGKLPFSLTWLAEKLRNYDPCNKSKLLMEKPWLGCKIPLNMVSQVSGRYKLSAKLLYILCTIDEIQGNPHFHP